MSCKNLLCEYPYEGCVLEEDGPEIAVDLTRCDKWMNEDDDD